MGCKMEACAECSRNCVILHGKNKSASPISFFKVMIGSQFSELLFIPPKFAPTVSGLLNRNIRLEDSGGRQWEVTLSTVDGSLAFQRGWNAFSCDHGLEVGYFLLFYYLGSHFRVDIYDRTGCRKDFSENRTSKKRTMSTRNSPDDPTSDKSSSESASVVSGALPDQSHCRTNVEEAVKQMASVCIKSGGKSQSLSKAVFAEELSFMINRDIENIEEARPAFDLFDFEMKKNKPCAGGNPYTVDGNGPSSVGPVISQSSHDEAGLADKDPILDSVNNWTHEETNRHDGKLEKRGKSEGIDKQETLFNNCTNEVLPIVKRELMEMNEDDNCKVERPRIVKQERVEMTPGYRSTKMAANMEIYGKEPTVKAEYGGSAASIASDGQLAEDEAINAMASSVHMAADTSYSVTVVTDCHSHLELPADLPSSFFKGTSSRDRKVVLLKDSSKRIWPVLYHARSGLRSLTSGWDGFQKANGIQQGDECVFQLQIMSSSQYLYEVSITRVNKFAQAKKS